MKMKERKGKLLKRLYVAWGLKYHVVSSLCMSIRHFISLLILFQVRKTEGLKVKPRQWKENFFFGNFLGWQESATFTFDFLTFCLHLILRPSSISGHLIDDCLGFKASKRGTGSIVSNLMDRRSRRNWSVSRGPRNYAEDYCQVFQRFIIFLIVA